jgi:hypothetical protein
MTKYCIKDLKTNKVVISSKNYWIVDLLFNFYEDSDRYILDTIK